MVIDPRMAAFVRDNPSAEAGVTPLSQLRASAASVPGRVPPGMAAREDLEVPGADGTPRRAYLYWPQRPSGATFVFVHGGGWVAGSPDLVDDLVGRLCAGLQCAALSVSYRLAPESPFPAGLDDVVAALRWARESLPGRPFVVGGESAGGNLVAAACRRLRDEGDPMPELQLLVYPVVDLDPPDDPSWLADADPLLSVRTVRWLIDQYVGPERRRLPEVSPGRASDLEGLPPAVVLTSDLDCLRDQGRRYAEQLASAGVPTVSVDVPGLAHGFANHATQIPAAAAAVEATVAAVRDLVERLPVR